jgi:phenylalanyl-tRNA synthetase alpha chain
MHGNLASLEFTETQKQRLADLGGEGIDLRFSNATEREKKFDEIELSLARKNKECLLKLLKLTKRPLLKQIERELTQALFDAGFTEVVTPSIISREFITRMGITERHALWRQIFWMDSRSCLRPMLAPSLYHVMADLRRISTPVSIFEVGSCFRKESKGREHAVEFTMLNVVELAPLKSVSERLKEMVGVALKAVGLVNYEFRKVKSEVYGETVDVMVNDVEVASGAIGPHALDGNWRVIDPWAGVGFGLERIAMVKKPCRNLGHVGRSLSHLDGYALNVM